MTGPSASGRVADPVYRFTLEGGNHSLQYTTGGLNGPFLHYDGPLGSYSGDDLTIAATALGTEVTPPPFTLPIGLPMTLTIVIPAVLIVPPATQGPAQTIAVITSWPYAQFQPPPPDGTQPAYDVVVLTGQVAIVPDPG